MFVDFTRAEPRALLVFYNFIYLTQIPFFVGILGLFVILNPYPSWEHFVWPLDYCVLADFCNHTWIPECGINKVKKRVHKRIFIDECDMFEYNCDYKKKYIVTNYSLCFGAGACDQPALRMGNYKLVNDYRRMFYDPTDKYGHEPTKPTTRLTFPSTVRPDLPANMFRGRRRWTPHGPPAIPRLHTRTTRQNTSKQPKRSTVILQRITFKKNGKIFVKIVKGFSRTSVRTTKADSDFLE